MENDNKELKRPLDDVETSGEETKKIRLSEDASTSEINGIPRSEATAPSRPQYTRQPREMIPPPISKTGLKPQIPILPPSLELVTGVQSDVRSRKGFISQEDVGIIGYVGEGLAGIRGVIKQRFTDFLVNEVLPSGEVLHLQDIGLPKDPAVEAMNEKSKEIKAKAAAESKSTSTEKQHEEAQAEENGEPAEPEEAQPRLPDNLIFENTLPSWTPKVILKLRDHFSDETIIALHTLHLEGKDAPPKSDGGWGARKARPVGTVIDPEEAALNAINDGAEASTATSVGDSRNRGGRGQGRDRGRGRGDRGGRGGRGGGSSGRDGDSGKWWTDQREVLSQPMPDKESRGNAHKIMRECFPGVFETDTKQLPGEAASRMRITFARGGGNRPQRKEQDPQRAIQRSLPNYIHFTLHKTNRDAQDVLVHLSKTIGCHIKDLSVCGTKDKRAATVQRVCLKRGARTLQSFWKSANGMKQGRKSLNAATKTRGDRGARIGDLSYSEECLALGMLKGNYFVITLRSLQTDDEDEIDKVMTSLRDHGFINFYGMQRFGTSTVPTHTTGLMILQGKWGEAVDSILSLREGEHPECATARLAWLEDKDLGKALEWMPRRCTAERSIWEYWHNGGDVTDKVGALARIPRNLRTMYAHAYQSYIWNLAVSERIKLSRTEPIVGDLVFVPPQEDDIIDDEIELPAHLDKRDRQHIETSSTREVKRLTEDDLPSYKIFDVVMPLPGFDVDYPGGEMGELYGKLLKADGLDIDKMKRVQREYSLPGSYRKIINHPSHVSWTHMKYTDPDIPLAQSDEDKILNLNPPAPHDPDGKFRALRIELQLGASAYATMALREVTKEETSTWHHINLTMKGEDQEHRGLGNQVDLEREDVDDENEEDEIREDGDGNEEEGRSGKGESSADVAIVVDEEEEMAAAAGA